MTAVFEALKIQELNVAQIAALVAGYGPTGTTVVNGLRTGTIIHNTETDQLMEYNGTTFITNASTAGFSPLPSGYWIKQADLSGPYVFTGSAMALASHV
jgi:hypothetical protein